MAGEMKSESSLMPSTVKDQQQKTRAFLRERFLRAMNGLAGKPMQIEMYENTKVAAEFGSSDIEFEHIQVKNLTTPMGTVPDALLRTSDIVSIRIPLGSMKDSNS